MYMETKANMETLINMKTKTKMTLNWTYHYLLHRWKESVTVVENLGINLRVAE